jgi:hypothetical protein
LAVVLGEAEIPGIVGLPPPRRPRIGVFRCCGRQVPVSIGPSRLAAPAVWRGLHRSPAGGGGANVLLVTIDTLRADRVGCYGHAAASTPVLDGLAARGVRFATAVAHVP